MLYCISVHYLISQRRSVISLSIFLLLLSSANILDTVEGQSSKRLSWGHRVSEKKNKIKKTDSRKSSKKTLLTNKRRRCNEELLQTMTTAESLYITTSRLLGTSISISLKYCIALLPTRTHEKLMIPTKIFWVHLLYHENAFDHSVAENFYHD